ncbi:MAG: hypothetical protein NZP74_11910 [Anaerolineales bacterium]|nr:hypothetical protein [Anaerolineales bacterium]MDW8278806.1 hypothetical protein [Anaerolineales bacterium]
MSRLRLPLLLAVLVLVLSSLACGFFSAPQAGEPPASSAPSVPPAPTEPPVSAPAESGPNPNVVIPCAKLIPADEWNNLVFGAASTLVENASPGITSCEWKYTPKGGTQESLFYLQAGFSGDTSVWESTRKSELSNEPSDIVVNSIDGLGDESYTWRSNVTGQYVVYVRQGSQTLIFRYNPQEILFMGTESGIIDMAQRIFERMSGR